MLRLHLLFPLIIFSIMLSACGQKVSLSPEEVIRRAVIRSTTVDSVAVSLSAHGNTEEAQTFSGSVVVQSILRSGGQAWSANAFFDLTTTLQRGLERASGRVVLISPGTGLTFVRLESIEGEFGKKLQKTLTGSGSGWMTYGEFSDVRSQPRHTPDPAILSTYADVIDVTENLGLEKQANGSLYHHYRVALKPEAMPALSPNTTDEVESIMHVEGELWIENIEFSLMRAKWALRKVPTELGRMTFNIDAQFSEYDVASEINAPTGTTSTLSLESIFDIFSQ